MKIAGTLKSAPAEIECVADLTGERRGNQCRWQLDVHLLEELDEVSRPPDCDGGGRKHVFEHEVPAHEPRYELAERRVAVGVSAAGNRHHRCELGVAGGRRIRSRARQR